MVCLYVMLAGVFTALLRWRSPAKAPLLFFASFGALVVLKNIGVMPFMLLGELPLFDQVWSQRWAGPTWTFSFAAAAGIGFHVVREAFKREEDEPAEGGEAEQGSGGAAKRFTTWASLPLLAALAAVLGIYTCFLPYKPLALFIKYATYAPFFTNWGPSFILGTVLTPVFILAAFWVTLSYARKGAGIVALLPLGLVELWWAVPRGYSFEWLFLKSLPLIIGLYAVTLLVRSHKKMFVAASVLFFLSFMVLDAHSPKGIPDRFDPFTQPPFVKFLKERGRHDRIIGGYGILFPNYSSAVGLTDVRYINSLAIDSFQDFRNRYLHTFTPLEGESSSLWFTGRPEVYTDIGEGTILLKRGIEKDIIDRLTYYSLIGVRHIVLPSGVDINRVARVRSQIDGEVPLEFPLVYDSEVKVYENRYALPRAYVAHDVRSADGYAQAQAMAGTPGFVLGRSVAIENAPPPWYQGPGTEPALGNARILRLKTTRVAIEATTSAPGVLVLNDAWYPGWRAYVDGKKAEIFRANGVVARGLLKDRNAHRGV